MKSLFTSILLTLFATTFAQIPSYVPSNGLVGWWPFNGNANDESGNGNNGTVNGATLTTDRNNISNAAYSFDGNNVLIPLNQTIVNMASRTISLWFNSSTPQSGGRLFETTSYSWGIGCYNSNQFDCWYQKSNINYNAVNLNFGGHDIWHNLVYICDSVTGNVKVYLNGVNVHSSIAVSSPGNPIEWLNHFIKVGQGNSNESFMGKIDDIALWNRSLTASEIMAIYEGCQLAIITQPQDVTTSVGTASFSVATTSTNVTYQWQTNLGVGFQNLSNAGQYSGATSATLTVSNLSMSNNNQVFRCIINDGACADTTAEAVLTIIDDAGFNLISEELIGVYPNPVQDILYVKGVTSKEFEYEVLSIDGKLLQKGKSQGEISVKDLRNGNYVLRIGQEQVSFVKQ